MSTDYVFDGTKAHGLPGGRRPEPQLGLRRVPSSPASAPARGDATIARVSWVAGFHGRNIVKLAVDRAQRGEPMRFVDDQRGSPSFAADLAAGLVTLVRDRPGGVIHLTNAGVDDLVRAGAGGRRPRRAAIPTRCHAIATSALDPAAARATPDKLGAGPWPPARPPGTICSHLGKRRCAASSPPSSKGAHVSIGDRSPMPKAGVRRVAVIGAGYVGPPDRRGAQPPRPPRDDRRARRPPARGAAARAARRSSSTGSTRC